MLMSLAKENEIEARRVVALASASIQGIKPDAIKEAIDNFLEALIPSIAEGRERFIQEARELLSQEAGKVQQLSNYKVIR